MPAREEIYWGNYMLGTIGRADLNGTHIRQSFIADAPYVCGLRIGPDRFRFVGVTSHPRTGTGRRSGPTAPATSPTHLTGSSTHRLYAGAPGAREPGLPN